MSGYIVFDKDSGLYLETFRKPVKGVDVAVTRWTEDMDHAMRFKIWAAARSAAEWLNDGGSAAVVLNEKGDLV